MSRFPRKPNLTGAQAPTCGRNVSAAPGGSPEGEPVVKACPQAGNHRISRETGWRPGGHAGTAAMVDGFHQPLKKTPAGISNKTTDPSATLVYQPRMKALKRHRKASICCASLHRHPPSGLRMGPPLDLVAIGFWPTGSAPPRTHRRQFGDCRSLDCRQVEFGVICYREVRWGRDGWRCGGRCNGRDH